MPRLRKHFSNTPKNMLRQCEDRKMIRNIAFDLLKFFIEFIKLFPVMYIIMDFELQNKKKILLYSLGAIFLCIIASLSGISGIMPITAYICFIYTILILNGKRKTIYVMSLIHISEPTIQSQESSITYCS